MLEKFSIAEYYTQRTYVCFFKKHMGSARVFCSGGHGLGV